MNIIDPPFSPLFSHLSGEEFPLYAAWYNCFRPHEYLKSRTPFEVYFQKRKRRKQYKVKGIDTEKLKLLVAYLDNTKHLPVIKFRKVA